MPQARRLRLVVLVHMPLGQTPTTATLRTREREVLAAATAVVTTSAWTRRRLLELYALPADRVHVAEPGVDAAALGTGDGGRRRAALRRGRDARQGPRRAARGARDDHGPVLAPARAWAAWTAIRRSPTSVRAPRARAAGSATACASRDRAPGRSSTARTPGRTCSCSPRAPRPTAWSSPRRWRAACRCSPPTSAGCPRPSGTGADGTRPGLLVPPGDPAALGAALRDWLGDAELRGRLRRAARERRASLRRLVGHDRPSSPASWRGRHDDRDGRPRQPGVARAARARRRGGALRRARRAPRGGTSPRPVAS